MGYGVWNASGLDSQADPKTIHFDYAYTSSEDFKEGQATGEFGKDEDWTTFAQEEHEDEFLNWSAAILDAGKHLKSLGLHVTTYDRTDNHKVWAHYGDRYQNLHRAFEIGKVAAFWQEEPFMGAALCVVTAPQYHLEEEHDVWMLDDAEFRQAYGISIDTYKASAERQAGLLANLVLAWMEHEMNAIGSKAAWAGSGYVGHCFTPDNVPKLDVAINRLVAALSRNDQRGFQAHKKAIRMAANAAKMVGSPVLQMVV
jgi:hypothetical protein